MSSPQTLSLEDRCTLAHWAAVCAERVLPLYEAESSDERVRQAVVRAKAFSRGEHSAAEEICHRFHAVRAASSAASPAGAAAARAAAQAAAVAHMGAHALGAAAYAARAAGLAAPQDPGALHDELRWQLAAMTPPVRAALSKLPAVGTDSSGPLGSGLLSSGTLGQIIGSIQAYTSVM